MYLGNGNLTLALVIISLLYVSKTEGNSVDLVKSSSKTSLKLYQMLKKRGENMFFSPISVQMAIAMPYTGAKGNTAKEIENVFKFPSRNETLNGLLEIIKFLSIKLANKMYVDEALVLKKSYEDDIKNNFLTTIGRVSFKNATKAAAEINAWAESQTYNKIKNIIKPSVLTPDTRLVLLNAIYFKADWKFPFDSKLTGLFTFHVSKDQSIDIDMMYQLNYLGYTHRRELKAEFLALPYADNQLEMIIILPDEIDGLEQVEEKIAKADLSAIFKRLRKRIVSVHLPKFKMESTFKNLMKALKRLGIRDLFSYAADLSRITDEGIFARKVIQKSFVEVNEKGTEAAVVTTFLYRTRSVQGVPKTKEFKADHPFMYMIKKGDIILFQGRYAKPSES